MHSVVLHTLTIKTSPKIQSIIALHSHGQWVMARGGGGHSNTAAINVYICSIICFRKSPAPERTYICRQEIHSKNKVNNDSNCAHQLSRSITKWGTHLDTRVYTIYLTSYRVLLGNSCRTTVSPK